jgi:PEP-CTERM motif
MVVCKLLIANYSVRSSKQFNTNEQMFNALGVLKVMVGTLAVAGASVAHAGVAYTENGDAGATLATAQSVFTPFSEILDEISGTLSPSGDVDFFRFLYSGTGSLTIAEGPYVNSPFPSNTFPAFTLFSASGVDLGGFFSNGDAGTISYEFGSASLRFSGLVSGAEYVLSVNGSGQINPPRPLYVGDYSLTLSGGAATLTATLPEPATLPLAGLALVGVWLARRRSMRSPRRIR